MYRIVPTRKFDRSLKNLEQSGLFSSRAEQKFNEIVNLLAQGKSLPVSASDHQLKGAWSKYRECHIRGDLLLVYEKRDDVLILLLIDIGSHSKLFG